MASLLLAIVYLSFISLGLPDGLLGAAWPVMHLDIDAPLSAAGVISIIITVGTILSSLSSDRLTSRFSTGTVTAVSVGMTACVLFGFSVSSAFWQLCLWAIPYGLGAGAVDAALNNYVALYYKARHMNWLHCFLGCRRFRRPLYHGCGFDTYGRVVERISSCVLHSNCAHRLFVFVATALETSDE